jgi:DNA-directed RNA polymerase specialized sigma24 family protein
MLCTAEVAQLTVQELIDRLGAQTESSPRGDSDADRYSFELFRRAIADRDQASWQALMSLYHEHVLHWCLRSGANYGDSDEMVEATWVKFWQSYTTAKFAGAADSTSAVLGYLKLCARSVVLDEMRRRARLVPLEERQHDAESSMEEDSQIDIEPIDAPAFWRLVEEHLRDDRDRLLVYLTYELGLRPAEIQRRHPEQFPSIRDVYRITRNILDRLRRSTTLAAWLNVDAA